MIHNTKALIINMQELQESKKSQKIKIISIILGSTVIALIIFVAGVNVGFHKAKFSYKFGENYERNFMNPPMMAPGVPNGPMGGMMRPGEFPDKIEGRGFRNPHGNSGTIISISGNSLVIKNSNNEESTISISEKTTIKSGRDAIKIEDLKTEDQIVVIGEPGDDGVVNAYLIRVFAKNNQ